MKNYKYYSVITGFFVASLYLANILDVKLFQLGPLTLPAGMLTFPITFLFGDVLTEVYGYGASRKVIWTGFISLIFMIIMVTIVRYLPPASFWHLQEEYTAVLGRVPRIVAASITAYFCSEFTNSYVLAKLKIYSKGSNMALRFVASTIVGQAVDSTIFCSIAFAGLVPLQELPLMIAAGWGFKSFWEIIALPISLPLVKRLKKIENEDYYDINTNFSPFKLQ